MVETSISRDVFVLSLREARGDPEYWGRLTACAVGAQLANAAAGGERLVDYWRERGREVDFVVKAGRRLTRLRIRKDGNIGP